MKHIAKRAGVSLGTVSNVINNTTPVKENLRRKVAEAIQELQYHPSRLAQGFRRNQTTILGMIIPDITNPFFPAVVRGVEDVAYQHSYRLMLCNADNDPSKEIEYLKELRSYRMAGLILIPSIMSEINALTDLEVDDVPVVCIDRRPTKWKGDSVTVNNAKGTEEATCYLLEMGHRSIAIITGPLNLASAIGRLDGFRTAMRSHEVIVNPEYIQEGRFDRASGYEKMKVLLSRRSLPTAVIAGNDLIALGALAAIREAGLNCPDDISIIGFDDLEISEFTNPPLTTVAQPGYQMGAKGVGLLLQRLKSSDPKPENVILMPELKVRHSASPPKR
ncbi:MAG TPA: LacI family DNA-binding transcriptional regulator [Terriglobales bacterium]|nr:LacI family DNA-binding transcriptional regulator [Terriglobales bacterium]